MLDVENISHRKLCTRHVQKPTENTGKLTDGLVAKPWATLNSGPTASNENRTLDALRPGPGRPHAPKV